MATEDIRYGKNQMTLKMLNFRPPASRKVASIRPSGIWRRMEKTMTTRLCWKADQNAPSFSRSCQFFMPTGTLLAEIPFH